MGGCNIMKLHQSFLFCSFKNKMENQIHNDDEPILRLNFHDDEEADIELDGGKAEVKIFNKQDASLEETPFKLLLELEGVSDDGRLGVDLVTILDISSSMNEIGLLKMKLAMDFLVQKLSRVDRLSVVTFDGHAVKLCPLRQITENSRTEIVDQVNDLVSRSSTNTEASLKLALKVLNERTRTNNRSVAILLMSNGIEDADSQAITVPVSEVPVYTFGFGRECDHELLRDIAKKSKEGTFTPVQDSDDLSVAFSTALAGLLNVCIEDLTLTVAPVLNSSQLNKVNAEYYPQTEQATVMEPITVIFSSLYDRETRKVLVNLTLPKVDKRFSARILKVELKYRVNGKKEFDSDERIINVTRTATPKDGEIPQVLAEGNRIRTASSIKEARILAFALALEASHESQRATALPDGIPSMNETSLMDEYEKQAKEFDENPETYVEQEDRVFETSPTPEAQAPKQQGWGLGSMLKQAAAAGISKATEIFNEHDPRAAYLGKK